VAAIAMASLTDGGSRFMHDHSLLRDRNPLYCNRSGRLSLIE
jgi:hypothetical protein